MNWSRIAVLLILVTALVRPLAAQTPTVRLRVTVTQQAPDDVDRIARALAATVRGRIEPYAEVGFTGFVINAGPAAAEILARDPRVARIDVLEEERSEPETESAPASPSVIPEEPLSVVAAEHVVKRVTSQSDEFVLGSYAYDGVGNITQIGPTPNADQFRYDGLGRLATSTVSGLSQSFAYDSYNNLTSVTTSGSTAVIGVDPVTNRLKATGPYNVFGTYDNAGRMTQYLGRDSFTYDALDMVKEAVVQGQRKVYLYGPADERIASVAISGGVETASDWTIRDHAGKVLRVYAKTMTGGERWSWKEDYIHREGQLLAAEVNSSARTLHFHLDHLGTLRLITGNGGATIGRHTYQPFGTEITAANQNSERMKFTGHERDFAGALTTDPLDYMHARYYSPSAGRFMSVDPYFDLEKAVREPQQWNRYSYVANNPLKYTDPDGRDKTIYILQSFAHDRTTWIWSDIKTQATNGYDVDPNRISTAASFEEYMEAAEETDLVITYTHAAAAGITDAKFFSLDKKREFDVNPVPTEALVKAMTRDGTLPGGVALIGCNTLQQAQKIAAATGVTAVGSVGLVTFTNDKKAIAILTAYFSKHGTIDQKAIDEVNAAICPTGQCDYRYVLATQGR